MNHIDETELILTKKKKIYHLNLSKHEIADDILNIDRAMRWGFAWSKGPFEILDEIGPNNFINKCFVKKK